jgi:hypothetical protein
LSRLGVDRPDGGAAPRTLAGARWRPEAQATSGSQSRTPILAIQTRDIWMARPALHAGRPGGGRGHPARRPGTGARRCARRPRAARHIAEGARPAPPRPSGPGPTVPAPGRRPQPPLQAQVMGGEAGEVGEGIAPQGCSLWALRSGGGGGAQGGKLLEKAGELADDDAASRRPARARPAAPMRRRRSGFPRQLGDRLRGASAHARAVCWAMAPRRPGRRSRPDGVAGGEGLAQRSRRPAEGRDRGSPRCDRER